MPSEPSRSFFAGTTPLAPPVGLSSGWTSVATILERGKADSLKCVPAYVLILNLKIGNLAQGCSCLRDLSVTNADGEYSNDAEHLARLLAVATLLPADVPSKRPQASTFPCGGHSQPRVMLLLETLFGAASSLMTGLRVHMLVFDDSYSPTSSLMHVMNFNDEAKKKNEAKNRPDPVNHDPRFARTRLICEADYAASLDVVFKGEATAKGPLDDYVRRYPYAASERLRDALCDATVPIQDHALHPLSPELLLRFSPNALLSRTETTTAATQLHPRSYMRTLPGKTLTYAPPNLDSSYLYCGRDSAVGAPLPKELVAAIAAAHEVHTPGLSWASYHFQGPPRTKRARSADAVSEATDATSATTEST